MSQLRHTPVPNAPVRPMRIITLEQHGAERKFDTGTIYKSVEYPHATPVVYMNVISIDCHACMKIQAVEGIELDAATREALRNVEPIKVSVFTDRHHAEYTYILCRRITADMRCDQRGL